MFLGYVMCVMFLGSLGFLVLALSSESVMMSVEDVGRGLDTEFCSFVFSRLDLILSLISLLFLSALSCWRCFFFVLLRLKFLLAFLVEVLGGVEETSLSGDRACLSS